MIEKLAEMLDSSENIVFFGGAGVSTESGIPDFRGADGIYTGKRGVPVEVILSHRYFVEHTREFFDYYTNSFIFPEALPNAAHTALAQLEKAGRLKAVITQNVDGLHTAAGSKEVLELHGSCERNCCTRCGECYPLSFVARAKGIPLCEKCSGVLKPEVVLYDEGLDMRLLGRAAEYIENCDMLIVGGTSLNVYPAAGLVMNCTAEKLAVINKTPTPLDRRAALVIREPIGEVLSMAVQMMINR